MDKSVLKKDIISGIILQGIERFSTQGIQFIVSVILARLLAPEDFGLIALVTVFLVISDIFIDGGFRNSIIQSQDINNTALNSVFWCNLTVALVIYAVLWLSAATVANFYRQPLLEKLLRVIGIIAVLHSLAIVNNALLIKKMLFRVKLRITMIAIIISASVGITMAYCGFGVWALVYMKVAEAAVLSLLVIFSVKWFPKFCFSWSQLAKHFNFGGKLLCISLIDQLFLNGFQLFTGKYYSLTTLSFYNRGNSYAKLAMNTVNNTISVVMFPAFSKLQNNPAQLRNALRKSIRILMFLEIPLMFALWSCSFPLVILLLTDKWAASTYFLKWACVEYLFWPLQVLNIWCIMARGDSTTALKIEIIKKTLLGLVVLVTFSFGFKIMIAAWSAISLLNFFFNSSPNGKALGYGALQQLKDISPFIFIAIVSAAVASLFNFVSCDMWGQLAGRGVLFCATYLILSWLLQRSFILEFKNMLSSLRNPTK